MSFWVSWISVKMPRSLLSLSPSLLHTHRVPYLCPCYRVDLLLKEQPLCAFALFAPNPYNASAYLHFKENPCIIFIFAWSSEISTIAGKETKGYLDRSSMITIHHLHVLRNLHVINDNFTLLRFAD
jgi:hypothetical protein